jgi:hypothetical protein
MEKAVSLPSFLLLVALGTGCASVAPPGRLPASAAGYLPSPAEWAAMEKCLPEGLTLESRFAHRGGPELDRELTTVRQKLREVRAYARDGKLYDEAGKELYFYRVPEYGSPPPPGTVEADQKHFQDLQKRYHLIEMYATQAPC